MAAIMKAKALARSGIGGDQYLSAVLAGNLSVVDFFGVMALLGRVFTANAGLLTTPVTWTATAAIDITKPAFWMSVPAAVAVIPIEAWLYAEAFGTSAQTEYDLMIGTGGSYTSGMTQRIPANNRSDSPMASACTFYEGGNTGVVVGSTVYNRIWRDGQQFAITKSAGSATASASDPNKFVWRAANAGALAIAAPLSQIALNQGSQAGTGFAGITYAEIPSSWLP